MNDRTVLAVMGLSGIVLAFLAFSVITLTSCAAYQQQEGSGVRAKLAQAYSTHSALTESVDAAYRDRDISAEEFLDYHADLLDAKNTLDSAKRAIEAGNTDTAQGKIEVALTIITALESRIAEDTES